VRGESTLRTGCAIAGSWSAPRVRSALRSNSLSAGEGARDGVGGGWAAIPGRLTIEVKGSSRTNRKMEPGPTERWSPVPTIALALETASLREECILFRRKV
jgi:hypothetical protein